MLKYTPYKAACLPVEKLKHRSKIGNDSAPVQFLVQPTQLFVLQLNMWPYHAIKLSYATVTGNPETLRTVFLLAVGRR